MPLVFVFSCTIRFSFSWTLTTKAASMMSPGERSRITSVAGSKVVFWWAGFRLSPMDLVVGQLYRTTATSYGMGEGTCRKIRFLASNVQNIYHNQHKSGDLKNKIIVNYMYFSQTRVPTKTIHIFNMWNCFDLFTRFLMGCCKANAQHNKKSV